MNTKRFLAAAAIMLGTVLAATTLPAVLSMATYNMGVSVAPGGAGVTNSWAILPAPSLNNGAPVVTYVNATSDKAGALIQCYRVAAISTASLENSTTSIYVDANPTPSNACILVIWHKTAETYERLFATAASTATNFVTSVAAATTVYQGDKVYTMEKAGSVALGAATVSVNGTGVFYGQLGLPLLIDVDGTSACKVNSLSGYYQVRQWPQ